MTTLRTTYRMVWLHVEEEGRQHGYSLLAANGANGSELDEILVDFLELIAGKGQSPQEAAWHGRTLP